jgi:hypothetical protein
MPQRGDCTGRIGGCRGEVQLAGKVQGCKGEGVGVVGLEMPARPCFREHYNNLHGMHTRTLPGYEVMI